jgi:hypothetical protein
MRAPWRALLISTIVVGLLAPSSAPACSLLSLRVAQADAVIESGYYWMAAFLLGGV